MTVLSDYTCDPDLHLYFADRALSAKFNAAKQKGLRYMGVIVQYLDDHEVYSSHELIVTAQTGEELVRELRQLTMRPGAPYAFLSRIFDTANTFEHECKAATGKTVEQLFPRQDLAAYERYKLQYNAQLSMPTRRGLFKQIFGRGR